MAKIALLIGVSEYEPELSPLPAAVKDIAAMQRVLSDPEMGGFDTVRTLENPERQSMEYEIETLFSGAAKDDLVLLFFSGHGIKDDAGKLYFATRMTRKNEKGDLIRSTAVQSNVVHDILNNSRARRQAIILDCCFSGAFDPALQAKDDGSVDLQAQLGAEGRVVLASSSSTQYSFEQQGAELSLYTRYLIEGIETGAGDQNSDGLVSMLELHEYARGKVQETAPKMTPKIIVMKDKGFEIVLAKARVADPKLKYRKMASRYANTGTIRPAGRAVLDTLRDQLGLTAGEAAQIESEILRPYQERLVSLERYRETLLAEAEHEYPLGEVALEDLNMLQQMLGLRDEDVLPIHQEVEVQFFKQPEVPDEPKEEIQQPIPQSTAQWDITLDLPLTADEMKTGAKREIALREGNIILATPAGISIGSLICLPGEGKPSYLAQPRGGNLYLKITEFSREKNPEFANNDDFNSFLELLKLGDAFYHKGRLDEAIAEYEKVIQMGTSLLGTSPPYIVHVKKTDFIVAYKKLGLALHKQGKLDDAIDAYRWVWNYDSNDVELCIKMENALEDRGKLPGAISKYQKALYLDPQNACAYASLGSALEKEGKREEAKLAYQKAGELGSKQNKFLGIF